MELTDEVKKNITVDEVIRDVIHYQNRINKQARYRPQDEAVKKSLDDEKLVLDAKIIALTNKVSATPEELKSFQTFLSAEDSDSTVQYAKAYIDSVLNQFYIGLHTNLLKVTDEYALDVATRLSGHYKLEHLEEEKKQLTIILSDIEKSGTFKKAIMDGNLGSIPADQLNDEFASTPSAREATILSDLVKNSTVTGSGWASYKDAVENAIKKLPAEKLNKITEERNVSIIFQNVVNSICSALGFEKPFDTSIKNTFKQRFQEIKEQARIEEPAPDNESRLKLN